MPNDARGSRCVCLIHHRTNKIFLNTSFDVQRLKNRLTIPKDIIGILVRHLAIPDKSSNVVLKNQGAILFDHCTLAVRLRLVPHNSGFKFEKLCAINANSGAIVFDLTHKLLPFKALVCHVVFSDLIWFLPSPFIHCTYMQGFNNIRVNNLRVNNLRFHDT